MASKATSKLLKKLGKKGWKKARSAAATPRGSALPAGIIRGVARVTGWKIDEDKNGGRRRPLDNAPNRWSGMRDPVGAWRTRSPS